MKLDRLPPNITGFFNKGEQLRALDGQAFKQACHFVAHANGGAAVRVDLDVLGRSYFGATIHTNSEQVSVLCNSVYPYLAFVQPDAFDIGFPDLKFIESMNLGATFAHVTDFQPLDGDWLESGLTPELTAELGSSERHQLAYWKPVRIGDLIFNSWD